MSGIDRWTGKSIGNYESALQSVEVIFTTRIGERVMLREFGCGLLELLGRLMVPSLFATFKVLIQAGIDLYEPRFSVRNVQMNGTVDGLRNGHANFAVEVDWRPRGHLPQPDYTVEDVRTFGLEFIDGIARTR